MKIGIDCRFILNTNFAELAGVGHYVYYLVKYILKQDQENQYVLFFYNPKIKIPEFEQQNVKFVYFPAESFISRIPIFYKHYYLANLIKKEKLDLYHNPANIIPLGYHGRSVISVHDLAIYVNPDWFPQGQNFNTKVLFPQSLKKAEKIIAVSHNTKNDLINIFKVPREKIQVIYEGVEDFDQNEITKDEIRPELKFTEPYLFFVGTIEPRKNIERLIKAYKNFIKENPGTKIKLVIAGKKGWKCDTIFKAINDPELKDKLIYPGYISLQEKIYLYKNCLAFIFPTLYEGFGLPVLEAMSLGKPVISSKIAPITEFAKDKALLINPQNIDQIKKAMESIAGDQSLRKSLGQKAIGVKSDFSWKIAAQKTIELYRELT